MVESLREKIAYDEYGYMLNTEDWSPALAESMSANDGITLTSEHWEIINLIRNYYLEFEIVPAIRLLTRAIGVRLGQEKGSAHYLYELFPDGAGNQAVRYAGLPRPTGCTKK